jgi:tRNA pseudouridine55 synthase
MLEGILIIDKPEGMTSHDVVDRARKMLKMRRIGHTGTLDPFATGVLVLCLNRATRIARFLAADEKEYLASMRLGFATDTGDLTGKPLSLPVDTRHITRADVNEVLGHFRGRIEQTPPMYSAKKIGGVKLYELARRGLEIERAPVEVEITRLELCESEDLVLSEDIFSFRVVCSSGTYIRSLAEDIGRSLGVGAHLIKLRRLRSGLCNIGQALKLEKILEMSQSGEIETSIIPISAAITLEELPLSEEEKQDILLGRAVKRHGDWLNGCQAKLCDSDRNLIAIAEFDAERQLWRPRIVLGEI